MEKGQIKEYEYCKKHLEAIKTYKEQMPFNIQAYGCGSGSPSIEHSLERIHKKMYEDVFKAINEAKDKVQGIIDNI